MCFSSNMLIYILKAHIVLPLLLSSPFLILVGCILEQEEVGGGAGGGGGGGGAGGGFWRDCVVCARCRSVACAKWQPLQRFCMGFGEKGVRVVFLVGGCVSFECEKWTPYGGFVCSPMLDND